MDISSLKEMIEDDMHKARELLEKVVSINSWSENPDGVNQVGNIFRQWFEELGMITRVFPRTKAGDILVLQNEAYKEKGGGFIFLSHMDTVFPPSGTIIPYSFDGKVYRGNGCCDDKGGGVIAWQTVKALKEAGLFEKVPLRVMLTTDEEIGSPQSKDEIRRETADGELVFVVEYGKPLPEGSTIVTNRLGRGTFSLDLKGPKAEAAVLEIMENSYFLATPESQRTIRLVDYERNPDHCRSRIYFGFLTDAEGDFMLAVLQKIVVRVMEQYSVKGDVHGEKTRPPLLFGKAQWDMVEKLSDIARGAGIKLFHENRKACSDGSFVPTSVPVLDGMGPIGDNVHTADEYMTADSLLQRPLLMSALIGEISGQR